MASISMQDTMATLYSISELTLIPAAISPPEGSSSVSFPLYKFTLVQIWLFTCPLIKPPAVFFIEFELAYVIISARKI